MATVRHALIICDGCGSTEDNFSASESAGAILLKRLQMLHGHWPDRDELAIETNGCLCMCDRACTIAFVATGKPTYLFGDLPPTDSAADLLAASELYLDSDNGMVPAYKLPAKLRPCRVARIPSAICLSTNVSGK